MRVSRPTAARCAAAPESNEFEGKPLNGKGFDGGTPIARLSLTLTTENRLPGADKL